MENNSEDKALNKSVDKVETVKEEKEIKVVSKEEEEYKNGSYEEIEKALNAKILEITLKIKKDRPELSKYLDEMPVTVPNKKEPHITLNLLKVYHESLVILLKDYNLEHPEE